MHKFMKIHSVTEALPSYTTKSDMSTADNLTRLHGAEII